MKAILLVMLIPVLILSACISTDNEEVTVEGTLESVQYVTQGWGTDYVEFTVNGEEYTAHSRTWTEVTLKTPVAIGNRYRFTMSGGQTHKYIELIEAL